MRKLMWFTIGFAAACALGAYCTVGIWLAVIFAILCIPLLFLNKQLLRIFGVICLGLSIGIAWFWGYQNLYIQPASQYDGERVCATVTVTDYSYETDYGVAADGEITLDGKDFRLRVYLTGEQALSPGDALTGSFRLRLTTPGSKQGSTYHQGEGTFLLAYADADVSVMKATQIPLQLYPAVLRQRIIHILDMVFSEEVLAFARALLLGDDSLLSYETDTDFKISGIRHIIAVSGLHVSILIAFVYLLSGRKRVLTAVLGFPILFLFAAIAGFTPSVVRACIMQGLMIGALLFDQEYDPPTSLAFAVLVMLLVNPLTITSVSFQLSVGCIIGIFVFYMPIYRYLYQKLGQPKGKTMWCKTRRWFCASVAVSVSATIVATPLSAIYFGTVSIVGILSNLLIMPVVSIAFYGIALCCVLGEFWLSGAQALAILVSFPIRYILLVAKVMASPHFAALYTCSIYAVLFLIFAYALFFGFWLCKEKRPAQFMICLAFGLVLTLLLSYLSPKLDRYRVTVLDVGQGQAILFQTADGTYLVDCGGDNANAAADTVAAELLSQGITQLDGIILTHYDKDHAGGVLPLLSRIPAKVLYLPDLEDSGKTRRTLQEKYRNSIITLKENTYVTLSSCNFSLYPGADTRDRNENSVCVLFQTENCDILITGDRGTSGEQALLRQVQLPDLEILIAGHHGSASAIGFPLLHATHPEAVIISVGADNPFGHPAEDVLFRLELFGCQVFRTDLDGSILFRG